VTGQQWDEVECAICGKYFKPEPDKLLLYGLISQLLFNIGFGSLGIMLALLYQAWLLVPLFSVIVIVGLYPFVAACLDTEGEV
jgi:hypothetical protein